MMFRQLTKAAVISAAALAVTLPAVASPAPPVTLGEVKLEHLGQGVRVSGVVQSRHDIELAATVDGELAWVLEAGTFVEANTVVAKVDDDQLELLIREQEVLANRARVNADYLAREVERLRELQSKNLASETQLAEMESRQRLADAEVQVVDVRIHQLEERLSRTQIVTPVGGVIAVRHKQGGEFANRGENIVRIVDPTALEVSVSVPVQHATRLSPGEHLDVAVGDKAFLRVMRAVVYAASQASQTIEVIVDLPLTNPGEVVDGQFAEVSIPLAGDDEVLFVPRDAVVLRSSGSHVFRVNNENKAEKIDVILGEGRGPLVSVSGDLSAGDRVVLRGAERLSDGQEVTPG